MNKALDWIFFKIRYTLYVISGKIFTRKPKKYIMFFVGKYPDNFKHGLKPILDNDHQLKWIFGPASIILIFHSKELRVRGILESLAALFFSDGVDPAFPSLASTIEF